MAAQRMRRLGKELADLQSDTHSHISVLPAGSSDDLTHLKGTFTGPEGTPYEGGTYVIDVRITSEYPFKPPVMKFDTKVWHPNVSSQTVSRTLFSLFPLLFGPFTHFISMLIHVLRASSASIPSPRAGHPS